MAALACFAATGVCNREGQVTLHFTESARRHSHDATITAIHLFKKFPFTKPFSPGPGGNWIVSREGWQSLRIFAETHECPEIQFQTFPTSDTPQAITNPTLLPAGWNLPASGTLG